MITETVNNNKGSQVSIFRDGFDADEESKDEEVFKYLTVYTISIAIFSNFLSHIQ